MVNPNWSGLTSLVLHSLYSQFSKGPSLCEREIDIIVTLVL